MNEPNTSTQGINQTDQPKPANAPITIPNKYQI